MRRGPASAACEFAEFKLIYPMGASLNVAFKNALAGSADMELNTERPGRAGACAEHAAAILP
jgi:hypothetical protein